MVEREKVKSLGKEVEDEDKELDVTRNRGTETDF